MEANELARALGGASDRLAALVDEARAYDGSEREAMVSRLLEELLTGIEELRVAEEELIVQGEQLELSNSAIDAERERYGRLFDFAPDGYLETDGHGKILEANVAASLMLGVPVRLLQGKLLVSFVSEADRRRIRRALSDVTDIGELPGEVQATLIPREREPIQVGVRVSADGDPVTGESRLRWMLRDISERLRLEEERRALQEDVDLLLAISDVSRLTTGADPLTPVITGVVAIAGGIVDGSVSVTLVDGKGGLSTGAASDDRARALSDYQHGHGGPCVDAARTGDSFEANVADLVVPWPGLAEQLRTHGVLEVLAVPLTLEGRSEGTVDVYTASPVDQAHRHALHLLADQASAAIANAGVYRSASDLASQLSAALEHRAVIEQAKGMLMAMQRVDDEEAFDILRRASQRSNRKLRDVAAELIERTKSRGGERRPPPPPPQGRS